MHIAESLRKKMGEQYKIINSQIAIASCEFFICYQYLTKYQKYYWTIPIAKTLKSIEI